ncbi:hypothetical protein CBS147333_10164 [Penicillium roqueforti]|nr:hypothetical protein CBS147333_10164 [Penicillium roqueforti]KAI3198686.1 hypothetical protein CBS147311_6365 [Penicillium roqueforti]KAI3260775.1 hypothetical protein CBS147308_10201 [Penicillium roqueforti]KAI3276402.1 hypothetical protein DTO003C3_10214 [Penicillium roqueforti]
MGHQKLNTLARQPFDSLMLQPKLCDIVKEFLCARWHRQRQADRVGRQWYEAAVRNQARVRHDSRIASLSVMVHLGQRQILSASRRRPASDNTDRSPPHELRQDPPMPLSTSSEPVQSINPFVTAEILRTNSVPWHVSPARPAILTSVANIWADVQDSTLRKLSLSEEVDNIHLQGAFPPGLRGSVAEKRSTGFGTSCCVCRNEGPLDALIRPLRVQSSDTETRHVHTASKPSPDRELATIRNSSPNDPSQSQPHQRSVGYQGMSVEQSLENGPRRSARVAGAYLPRDPSTSAPLRRSARLNSTQRR